MRFLKQLDTVSSIEPCWQKAQWHSSEDTTSGVASMLQLLMIWTNLHEKHNGQPSIAFRLLRTYDPWVCSHSLLLLLATEFWRFADCVAVKLSSRACLPSISWKNRLVCYLLSCVTIMLFSMMKQFACPPTRLARGWIFSLPFAFLPTNFLTETNFWMDFCISFLFLCADIFPVKSPDWIGFDSIRSKFWVSFRHLTAVIRVKSWCDSLFLPGVSRNFPPRLDGKDISDYIYIYLHTSPFLQPQGVARLHDHSL